MQSEILPVPIRFTKNGFLYWQVCRTAAAAIYEQKTTDGRSVFFEVWKIRSRGGHTWEDKYYPAAEVQPRNEDWGRYGWTFYRLTDAQKKYDEINQAYYNRRPDPAENGHRRANQEQPGDQVPTVNLGALK